LAAKPITAMQADTGCGRNDCLPARVIEQRQGADAAGDFRDRRAGEPAGVAGMAGANAVNDGMALSGAATTEIPLTPEIVLPARRRLGTGSHSSSRRIHHVLNG
jgi:hypothetical protein